MVSVTVLMMARLVGALLHNHLRRAMCRLLVARCIAV